MQNDYKFQEISQGENSEQLVQNKRPEIQAN